MNLASRTDIRSTETYAAVESWFDRLMRPGFGRITDGADCHVAPDGDLVAFTAVVWEALEGTAPTRIAVVSTEGGVPRVVSTGPGSDRLPRWSPDGSTLAFLSDRKHRGRFQLHLLRPGELGEATAVAPVEGTVEYFHWSPDGSQILLATAGLGADMAGGQGSGTTASAQSDRPSWMPEVDAGIAEHQWRRLVVVDVADGTSRPLSRHDTNVWEAAWCGPHRVLAVVSHDPGESAWYDATLVTIELDTGDERLVHRPRRQLGWPAATPDGRRMAVVEAVCSDRWVVAGNIVVTHGDGTATAVDTGGVDVTQLHWLDDRRLFYSGQRGLTSVVASVDTDDGTITETIATNESFGKRYPEAAPHPAGGAVVVLESFRRAPALARVLDGRTTVIADLATAGTEALLDEGARIEARTWSAPDGLAIEGLLCRPPGPGPFPLVVAVHGGPVWAYRDRWQMGSPQTALLVSRGYAVLHPNPRGSGGRGQAFAEAVCGDMGGADTDDYLAGVDSLVAAGVADPDRLAVTGGSYGGFMSAWLLTRTTRFAAAAPLAPCTNWYSQHFTSNIAEFDRMFLDDDPRAAGGRYFERSPVMFADRVTTPTFQVTGGLDRCTPPGQAVEFHHALLEAGVTSVLAIYPEEGHGVRNFPAVIDHLTRLLAFFDEHVLGIKGEAS